MGAYAFEASGKLKKKTPEELAQADASTAIISLTTGHLKDGRPFYAYVAVRPSKYREFYLKTVKREVFVINDYGRVIITGFDVEPPTDVVQQMRERYGYDDDFIKKLQEEVSKERAVFSEKQEENSIMEIVAMLKKNQPNS